MRDMYIIVIIVVVIVAIILMVGMRNRGHSHHKGDHHHHHKAHSANKGGYETVIGPVEQQQDVASQIAAMRQRLAASNRVPVQAARGAAPAFPRHEVQAAQPRNLVTVGHIADLFSPKTDYVAEYGMTQEQMKAAASKIAAEAEYKPRRVPRNQHFDMDEFLGASDAVRSSMKTSSRRGHSVVEEAFRRNAFKMLNREPGQRSAPEMASIGVDAEAAVRANRQHASKSSVGATIRG